MQPDPTTTGSGSGTPGPSDDPLTSPGKIAGGPEAPVFVALNSVAGQLPGSGKDCKDGFDPESETAAAIASRRQLG